MKRNLIGKLTMGVLGIVIIINILMLIRIWLPMTANDILRENKATYAFPEGFTSEKTKLLLDNSSVPAGWVVRYASNECIYCKLDFYWEHYVDELERLNYRIILLLPKETDQFDHEQMFPKTAMQLAFVKTDWVKQFRFTGTPTVVIFDKNGRVLWRHAGILKESDYKMLKKVIEGNSN